MKFVIECIKKSQVHPGYRSNQNYGIEQVGGKYDEKNRYELLTAKEVIERIELGDRFFTHPKKGPEVEVKVIEGESGPYLRTVADDSEEDNLLHLGPCDAIEMTINLEVIRRITTLKQ